MFYGDRITDAVDPTSFGVTISAISLGYNSSVKLTGLYMQYAYAISTAYY